MCAPNMVVNINPECVRFNDALGDGGVESARARWARYEWDFRPRLPSWESASTQTSECLVASFPTPYSHHTSGPRTLWGRRVLSRCILGLECQVLPPRTLQPVPGSVFLDLRMSSGLGNKHRIVFSVGLTVLSLLNSCQYLFVYRCCQAPS